MSKYNLVQAVEEWVMDGGKVIVPKGSVYSDDGTRILGRCNAPGVMLSDPSEEEAVIKMTNREYYDKFGKLEFCVGRGCLMNCAYDPEFRGVPIEIGYDDPEFGGRIEGGCKYDDY